MLSKLLCKLDMHRWVGGDRWFPNFHAPIVTCYESRMECARCGKVDEVIFTFDEVDGRALQIVHNGIASEA